MKKTVYAILALAALPILSVSCEPEEQGGQNNDTPAPSVELTPGAVSESSVSFTIVPDDAEKCAWYCIEKTEEEAAVPEAAEIFEKGTLLEEVKTQVVTVNDLKPETEYVISAAVSSGEQFSTVKEALVLKTDKLQSGTTMEVHISDVTATTNTITFTITSSNAAEGRYYVLEKEEGVAEPDEYEAFAKGDEFSTYEPATITVENKKDNTPYIIYAAVEAADSYDKIMDRFEITTKPLGEPEEVFETEFTEGELAVYRGGTNYEIKSENQDYSIKLDFYADDASAAVPAIAEHTYTFDKHGAGAQAWSINTISKVTFKDGTEFNIEKGDFTVSHDDNGRYAIEGRFISDDNRAFDFTFNGSLSYPIISSSESVSASVAKSDNGYDLTISAENCSIVLKISGSSLAGHFEAGSDLGAESGFSFKSGSATYTFKSGSVDIEDKGDGYYNVTGNFVTAEGYGVIFSKEYLKVEEVSGPAEGDEIIFTEASAVSSTDPSGWMMSYRLELENADGWSVDLDVEDFGEETEFPTGNYLYASSGGGDVSFMHIKGPDGIEYTESNLGDGYVKVSKDGETYTVSIDIPVDGKENFKATYTGPIECVPYM